MVADCKMARPIVMYLVYWVSLASPDCLVFKLVIWKLVKSVWVLSEVKIYAATLHYVFTENE